MKKPLRHVRIAVLFASLSTAFCGYTQNLVSNPGAESALGTEWTIVRGGTSCNTSSTTWRALGNTSGYPNAYNGSRFFAPGCGATGLASGTTYEIYQDVDMATYEVMIDAGQYQVSFSGYMQSFDQSPADQTNITVEYLNASKGLISSNTSGTISNVSFWGQYTFTRTVPINTRYIRIRLLGVYRSGDAIDSYFDNISLTGLSILPVNLISFTAAVVNTNVELNWQTNSESNNKGFMVQQSADGLSWKTLGFVPAKSAAVNNYIYTDNVPLTGYSYYRLVQEDIDGKKKISELRAVKIGTAAKPSIFPNPVKNVINIRSLPPTASVSIINATGAMLGRYTQKNIIDVSHLTQGAYYLKIEDQENTEMLRFMKL